jgi:hypothetical protein
MTFLIPLLGIGKTALQWFARLPWYILTIAALCAVCVILWTGWGKSADGLKAERVAHAVTRKSVANLMLAVKNQNDAIETMATDSKNRIQAGKEAVTARSKARVAVDSRIAALSLPLAFKDGCATPDDVAGSGL